MTWLQDDRLGPKLSVEGKARALPFALISKDVYEKHAGAALEGAVRKMSWIEAFADPDARSLLSKVEKLEVTLGGLFGFNAALYELNGQYDSATVVAFEGTTLGVSPAALSHSFGSVIFADLTTTVDGGNKGGEPIVDRIFKRLFGKTVFSQALNAHRAPSTAYDLADLLAGEARRRYGASTILTGHSLGGGLAQYGAARNRLRAIGFNSAGAGLTVAGPDAAEMIVRIDTEAGKIDLLRDDVLTLGNYAFNHAVTRVSDLGSRHLGTRYVAGKGGHLIAEVIAALRRP